MDEVVWAILGGLFVLGVLVGLPIMTLVAYVRTKRIEGLAERVDRLEQAVRQFSAAPTPSALAAVALQRERRDAAAESPITVEPGTAAAVPAGAVSLPSPRRAAPVESALSTPVASAASDAASWELFIGRKALGWLAVVVLLFAAAFFLRYAFENQWVGPIGRVSLGIIVGLALVAAGRRYLERGWRAFAQMLLAAGIVLLYLSTYSAFGFYHLLPQRAAGLFLFLIVAESMLLALRAESPAIAIMAVIGGLLTPLVMHSDHDQYRSLFLYLTVLDAAAVGVLLLRAWPVVGTVSLVGTQGLFWLWYVTNYHPEKLPWAIGFQFVVFLLYFGQVLVTGLDGRRRATWEDLARYLATAAFWFAAAYVLLHEDYRDWLGSLAVVMAAVYTVSTQALLRTARPDERLSVASIAVASGFVALAMPLQAETRWVALGWAAEAGALWWFGLRIASPYLRGLAAVVATLAIIRVLDIPPYHHEPFLPILNPHALPALLTIACLALALAGTRGYIGQLRLEERVLAAVGTVACVLSVWWVISVDINYYFIAQQLRRPDEYAGGRLAQMSRSAWWAVYAAIVLSLGFRTQLPLLRWTALGLFALTLGKVFLFDMADLDEIYRIVAFFVLAILLGAAAWAYQHNQPEGSKS